MADTRLIDKLAPMVRKVERVPMPGVDMEVGILRMMAAEIEDAEVAAREHLIKRGLSIELAAEDGVNEDMLERRFQAEAMFRAVVDPQSKGQPENRIFASADEVQARLEPYQRSCLMGWLTWNQSVTAAKFKWPGGKNEAPDAVKPKPTEIPTHGAAKA